MSKEEKKEKELTPDEEYENSFNEYITDNKAGESNTTTIIYDTDEQDEEATENDDNSSNNLDSSEDVDESSQNQDTNLTDSQPSFKDRIKKLEDTNKSLNGRISAADKSKNELQEKLDHQIKEYDALKEQLTEMQDKSNFPEKKVNDDIDDTFKDEFPDLEEPLQKRISKQLSQKTKPLEEKVTKLETTIKNLSTNAIKQQERNDATDFHNEIQKQIPDVNIPMIIAKGTLETWIKTKPFTQAQEYYNIAREGSVDDAVELVKLFAKETKQNKNTATSEKKAELNSMIQPKSYSTGPSDDRKRKTIGKDDFEEAFNFFAQPKK